MFNPLKTNLQNFFLYHNDIVKLLQKTAAEN